MVGLIERMWRLIPKEPLVPVMMVVICVNGPTDPARRAGYGGVIAVPSPAPSAAPSTPGSRPDALTESQRRDLRAARGRVLYAPGHAPRDTAALRGARDHKPPCPMQRVGDGRTTAARTS